MRISGKVSLWEESLESTQKNHVISLVNRNYTFTSINFLPGLRYICVYLFIIIIFLFFNFYYFLFIIIIYFSSLLFVDLYDLLIGNIPLTI